MKSKLTKQCFIGQHFEFPSQNATTTKEKVKFSKGHPGRAAPIDQNQKSEGKKRHGGLARSNRWLDGIQNHIIQKVDFGDNHTHKIGYFTCSTSMLPSGMKIAR